MTKLLDEFIDILVQAVRDNEMTVEEAIEIKDGIKFFDLNELVRTT